MSSIIAHGLASLTVYEAAQKPAELPSGWKGVLLGFCLGVIPDLDVLAMMALPELLNHRGPSHSLVFAWGLAGAASVFFIQGRGLNAWLKAWLAMGLVMSVHPLLDYLMACGPGVPFLWPWSEATRLSPVQLVPTAYYARSLEGLISLLSHAPSLQGLALELVIFLPLLALVLLIKNWGISIKSVLMASLLACVSLAGIWQVHAASG